MGSSTQPRADERNDGNEATQPPPPNANAESDDTRRQSSETIPVLSAMEQREVQNRVNISAAVVHETVREEGERELARSWVALAFSGLAAGLSMGFSLVGQGLLRSHLPATPWRPLVSSFGYCLGFVIVIAGRQQLFTENTLTVVLPLLANPNLRTLLNVCRLWFIVLVSNLIGAFIFATVVAKTAIFTPEINHAFAGIALDALRGGFGLTILRGIFAGWLIALVVWLLPAAQQHRLHIIIILTYFVGLGGFAHIIAGSVEVFYGVSVGQISWAICIGGFIAPTLIGNIVGGASLVAALNYGQVAGEHLTER